MLHPIDRANAKWDFMRYSGEVSADVTNELDNVKHGIIIEKEEEKYEHSFKCFSKEYPKFRKIETSLNWYTR